MRLISFAVLSALLLTACEPKSPIMGVKGTKVPFERYQHCNDFVPKGFPQHSYKERKTLFVCQSHYVMEFNPYTGTAMWVGEKLDGQTLKQNKNVEARKSVENGGLDKGFRKTPTFPLFHGEPTLKSLELIEQKDFTAYQLASPKNWLGNDKAQTQTFYLTNIFPAHKGNLELFNNTEDLIRQTIEKAGEGYVISGAVYYGQPNNLGSLKVGVHEDVRSFLEKKLKPLNKPVKVGGTPSFLMPTHLYKLIYLPKTKQTAVFILPNTPTKETNPRRFISTLQSLEKMTSLKFFPEAE